MYQITKKHILLTTLPLILLFLSSCIGPRLIPINKSTTSYFNGENIEINAVYTERLRKSLTIYINQNLVIDQLLGDPTPTPYNKQAPHMRKLTYKAIHGQWREHSVRVEGSMNIASARLYPDCEIFIDNKFVCTISF